MPPNDALAFGASLLIVAAVLLWQQPVCPHGCEKCDTERKDRDARRAADTEKTLHDFRHPRPRPDCPQCNRE